MAVFVCPCGARYKVPLGAEGRKVRCKRCGRIEQLPEADEGPFRVADDVCDGAEVAAATASVSPRMNVEDPVPPAAPPVARSPTTGFWADFGWSFLFFTSPTNLMLALICWVLQIVKYFLIAGFGAVTFPARIKFVVFLVFAILAIEMFFTAWYMRIVTDSAAGEDDLPGLNRFDDWLEDVVVPALHYAIAWLLLVLPALGYAFATGGSLSMVIPALIAGADPYSLLTTGGGADVPMALLVCLALFLWPIALLCVSMGGLSTLVRIDLIVPSVVRTFIPYLAIVLLVGVAAFLPDLIVSLAAGVPPASGAAGGGAFSKGLWLAMVACGVEIYVSIAVMRLIGLYYRHHKHKLSWDWE